MLDEHFSFRSLLAKSIVAHTITYFIAGVIAMLTYDYATLFSTPPLNCLMRPIDHPLVMAGVLFQPIRGALFAIVFWLLRDAWNKPRGWLTLWLTLFILGILNTFGPAPCSIEGMVYTVFPFWDHITGLPETTLQSLAFASIVFYWVRHPEKRWVGWVMGIVFVLVMSMPVLGLLAR